MPSILSRRLIFVVGKGGVGKSTVAAALALALRRRGRRVLLAAIGGDPPSSGEGVATAAVDGEAAFVEYLSTVLPAAIARRVAGSRAVRRFTRAAPGLRELMAIGKVAHEERAGAGDRPRWDAIVVDMPATGHALETLRMPAAAGHAFGGLVRWESDRIVAQLRDPARTAICLVSTAEELPVRETIEAEEELRGRLELPVGALVVNALHEAPVAADRIAPTPAGADSLTAAILACGREEAAWSALNRRWSEELVARVAAPVARLPWLGAEELGLAELAALGGELERQLGGAP